MFKFGAKTFYPATFVFQGHLVLSDVFTTIIEQAVGNTSSFFTEDTKVKKNITI
jgi:hypothetical protein